MRQTHQHWLRTLAHIEGITLSPPMKLERGGGGGGGRLSMIPPPPPSPPINHPLPVALLTGTYRTTGIDKDFLSYQLRGGNIIPSASLPQKTIWIVFAHVFVLIPTYTAQNLINRPKKKVSLKIVCLLDPA